MEVLVGKHIPKRKNYCYALEAYEETPVFIPMDMMEDVVKSVAQKLSASAGPSGTYSEALQGCILKFGDNLKRLCISVECFVECMAN